MASQHRRVSTSAQVLTAERWALLSFLALAATLLILAVMNGRLRFQTPILGCHSFGVAWYGEKVSAIILPVDDEGLFLIALPGLRRHYRPSSTGAVLVGEVNFSGLP